MFYKTLILIACWVGLTLGDQVLLWGDCSRLKPSLQTIPQSDFTEDLKLCGQKSMLLVISESELSFSDFKCSKSKDDVEASCFSNMKGFTHKAYYPNVVNPEQAAHDACSEREYLTVDSTGNYGDVPNFKIGKCVFLSFDEPDIQIYRNEELAMHDAIIADIYQKMSASGEITAVYTGKQPTREVYSRQRRAATAPKESGTWFRSGHDFLIYFTSLLVHDGNVTSHDLTAMSLTHKNNTFFTVELEGPDTKLNFDITLSLGYFLMSNLNLNGEAYYVPPGVNSPTDFSYYCGNQTFSAQSSKKVIMWNSLQMQAPFNSTQNDTFVFGDPWYCVGFFSPGILAGLFVVLILLAIMSVGICWMMDINTMDRFDDPKGKTITISVTE